MNQEIRALLEKARNLLAYRREMGQTEIGMSPELDRFLAGDEAAAAGSPGPPAPKAAAGETLYQPAPDSAAGQPLDEIHEEINNCARCGLHQGRARAVPGCGSGSGGLMVIEDQPGPAEEGSGLPFSGEAGELFDKMMKAIGLERSDIYLTSIVKCRPGKDREPDRQEIRTCLAFLARQVAAVRPAVICTMGPVSSRVLTGIHQPLFRFRGRFYDVHGTPTMPTFHPAFLIKNPELKKLSWADLQLIQRKLPAGGTPKK